jgi:hypothetical protein
MLKCSIFDKKDIRQQSKQTSTHLRQKYGKSKFLHMTSDIKGVKKCDVGGHDTGLYTTVKISEPWSGREVNVCQDQHHAAVFINPENPRAAANKKL